MNLIYYYSLDRGSPSNVSRKLLTELLRHKDSLPFKEIILFSKPKDIAYIKNTVKNLRVISYRELNCVPDDYLVHFPVLPTILPNSKFLLYLDSKIIKRKKIIIQYHGDVRTELKSSYKDIRSLIHLFSYILLPNLLKSADSVVTHSYYMNKIIEKYGVTKSVVIPNAIEDLWFQKNDNNVLLKNPIDKNKFNIFYHGRLSWEKGIDILLEAFSHYKKTNPNTTLYLAGEGPQKEDLKKLCHKLNIVEKVIFLGNMSKEELMYFLKSVNVAVYPSRFDNFPLAVLEALACANCPVYFSKNIGIYDFVVQDGFELNYFNLDVINLTEALDFTSTNMNKDIVNQQVQFASKYTWSKVSLKYVKLYHELINERL